MISKIHETTKKYTCMDIVMHNVTSDENKKNILCTPSTNILNFIVAL